MINLRPYQQDLYDRTQQAFREGHRKPLIVAPCGSGKSYLFAKMVEQASRVNEVLILIHRLELKDQHIELFKSLNIPMKNIRIEMVLTEAARLGQHEKPRMLILDEAHLSKANSWVKVVQHYNTFTVGFTATPCRLDGKPLGDIYDSMVAGPEVQWLIDNNCLAPYDYYAPTLIDVSSIKKRAGDYAVDDLEPLVMDKALYGDVVKTYRELANGKKSIAYCVSIKHSKEVAEAFNEKGIPAAHIDGDTPTQERKRIMDDFRQGKIKILCNVGIIAEGLSVSDCDCCLLLRPTDSLALYIQSSMRCMRYLPGKRAIILDFVGNYTRHGLPSDRREWTLDKQLEARKEFNSEGAFNVRECPKCYKVFKTAPKCPYCGLEYTVKPRELEKIKEIELKKIAEAELLELEKQKKLQKMEVGMARSYADLLKIERTRGYKRGWAYLMAKRKGLI